MEVTKDEPATGSLPRPSRTRTNSPEDKPAAQKEEAAAEETTKGE